MATDGARRRVSDVVHERLRGDILEGRLAAGDAVPSERVLAEELGVNRHAVREALKRLQQAGLVRISQGGATRVLDWRESGGVELLLDLIRNGAAAPPREVIRAVLELRALIGVDAVRRFLARADDRDRVRLADDVERTLAAIEDPATPDSIVVVDYERLWRTLVAGADNVAYRLLLNSLIVAVHAYADLAVALVPRDAARMRRLARAVRDGDGETAATLVAAQLEADALAFG
ncbi:FadR/GntR family transcriptional regulator [Patulibacter defluvii]|uniref:FadR/GntR family transcriptional regulator n=1 Tax=Patulibacter defluvii TaxID=3095358 RepID=UPI002A761EE7|nr:GntR family transcriptional regulator [Patulibacter sp. DM4]